MHIKSRYEKEIAEIMDSLTQLENECLVDEFGNRDEEKYKHIHKVKLAVGELIKSIDENAEIEIDEFHNL